MIFNSHRAHQKVLMALYQTATNLAYAGKPDAHVQANRAVSNMYFFVERVDQAGFRKYERIKAAQSNPLNDFGCWRDLMFGTARDPSIVNGYIIMGSDFKQGAAGGNLPPLGLSLQVPAGPNGLGKCKWWTIHGMMNEGLKPLQRLLRYFDKTQIHGNMKSVLWYHSPDRYYRNMGGSVFAVGRPNGKLLKAITHIGVVDPAPQPPLPHNNGFAGLRDLQRAFGA